MLGAQGRGLDFLPRGGEAEALLCPPHKAPDGIPRAGRAPAARGGEEPALNYEPQVIYLGAASTDPAASLET